MGLAGLLDALLHIMQPAAMEHRLASACRPLSFREMAPYGMGTQVHSFDVQDNEGHAREKLPPFDSETQQHPSRSPS